MNNEQNSTGKRNIWNLVLGIAFTGYGGYRVYHHLNTTETDTFGLVLAIAFVGLGIYDLYKYFVLKV